MGGDDERAESQLEVMIEGVFAPARFLDLIRDFVLFESDGARTWKVMAKYHQVHAVDAAVESVARGDGRRPARRAGLAHAGRGQELHDGVLRQQAAPRPAVREPDGRRGHRPHRPRQPARSRRSRGTHLASACPAGGRRSPAARRACTSCSTCRRAGSCSRRSRSSRPPRRERDAGALERARTSS